MTAKSTLTPIFNSREHKFHHAAWTDDFATVEAMLNEGININHKDGAGWTALMFAAARANSVELTSFLIARGADATIRDNDGLTALEWSVKYNKDEAAAVLRRDPAEIRAEYAAYLARTAATLGQRFKARKPLQLQ